MPELPIEFPLGGLSDEYANEKQARFTTRQAVNARGIDPATGRTRGGQRAGTRRYVATPANGAGNPVKRIGKVTHSQSVVTYSQVANGSGSGQVEDPALNPQFQTRTPTGKGACRNLVYDRSSNVIALDGNAGVVKYNSAGEEVWKISLPVDDEFLQARALAVDDFNRIYVGISGVSLGSAYSGGRQSAARIFCFLESPDDETPELVWELKPRDTVDPGEDDDGRGAFVEEIKVHEGKLYTVQNEPDINKAYLRVYSSIASEVPEFEWEREISHPVNGMDVGKDGSPYFASGPNTQRGLDPRSPDTTAASVDWKPQDLAHFERRIWSWYSARNIDGLHNATYEEDGVEIEVWRDLSGAGRHLVVGSHAGFTVEGPRFKQQGTAAGPSVFFDQSLQTSTTAGTIQAMRSAVNPTVSATYKDLQRTMVPGYTGSRFVLFLLVRCDNVVSPFGSRPRNLLGYVTSVHDSGHQIALNRASNAAEGSGVSVGQASVFQRPGPSAGGSGGGGQPNHQRYDAMVPPAYATPTQNFALLTYIHGNAAEASCWRVNGQPADRWTDSGAITISAATQIGAFTPGGGGARVGQPFEGEIFEMLCLREYRASPGGTVQLIDYPLYPNIAWASNGDSELERVEGYLMHKWGLADRLPTGAATGTVADVNTENYPHPFTLYQNTAVAGFSGGPPRVTGIQSSSKVALLNDPSALLAKLDPNGDPLWVIVGEPDPGGANTGVGGVGYGVRVSQKNPTAVYSIGPEHAATESAPSTAQELTMHAVVRKILDEGDDYSLSDTSSTTWEDGWATVGARDAPQDAHPRMAVGTGQQEDRDFDTLTVPVNGNVDVGFYVYLPTGSAPGVETTPALNVDLPDSQGGMAVAVDPNAPIYPKALGVTYPEKLAIGAVSLNIPPRDETVLVYRLVTSVQNTNQPRVTRLVAVSAGGVRVATSGGTWAAPVNGTTILLNSTARWVDYVEAFGRGYFADGRNYLELTPDEGPNGTLRRWIADSSGQIPPGGLLLALQNGRVWTARFVDNPQNWACSKLGFPKNWDFTPSVFDPRQAVLGNDSRPGLCPDIITALCPIDNDKLVFGGDHTLQLMRGDPADGGRFDLISDKTGMAFGRSWTKDPNGALYFFGSMGGLYRMPIGSVPQRVSLRSVEERLRDVDLDANYVELQWDWRNEGVAVYVIPKTGRASAVITQFFFDMKNGGAPWEDQYPFAAAAADSKQVTCSMLYDGDDPDDRVLLIGREDGRVAYVDGTAFDDDAGNDNNPIFSRVLIGPLTPPDATRYFRFYRPSLTLASDQGGARAEFFLGSDPDNLSGPFSAWDLEPGRNPKIPMKARGASVWIALTNSRPGERWAYEGGAISYVPAGRVTV